MIKNTQRLRPIPGFDSPNLVEYSKLMNLRSIDFSDLVLREHKGIDFLACFQAVKIVQPVNYTCPIKTIVLFVHNQPLTNLKISSGKSIGLK